MKVLLTGAAGGMGQESLKQMAADHGKYEIIALDLDNESSRKRLQPYEGNSRIRIMLGDLTDASFVENAVQGCDLILHVAACVSPAADYYPKKAMEVNYGGTRNLIEAIKKLKQDDTTRFVYNWCPECERKSWNYGARAKVDPFFAQVWNPLHDPDEMRKYPKEVTELDI